MRVYLALWLGLCCVLCVVCASEQKQTDVRKSISGDEKRELLSSAALRGALGAHGIEFNNKTLLHNGDGFGALVPLRVGENDADSELEVSGGCLVVFSDGGRSKPYKI
ncbi:hypothetical protein VNO77_24566 [Canavalia gladiata]|uniref:Uncharacterized protein n=1 Tax=Canavalia gladiata TaxID=3824 RepID=A0AAN9L9U7_CANGL